jgi:hypothetical protein
VRTDREDREASRSLKAVFWLYPCIGPSSSATLLYLEGRAAVDDLLNTAFQNFTESNDLKIGDDSSTPLNANDVPPLRCPLTTRHQRNLPAKVILGELFCFSSRLELRSNLVEATIKGA